MSGQGIRLYTDEDVHAALAVQLRRRGFDVLSCHEAGNAGQRRSDDWQLAYAAALERAILTHNIADFIELDRVWKTQGRTHWGIIVADQELDIGDLVRRTEQYLNRELPESQRDIVRFL